jgi:hypothetical protein
MWRRHLRTWQPPVNSSNVQPTLTGVVDCLKELLLLLLLLLQEEVQ